MVLRVTCESVEQKVFYVSVCLYNVFECECCSGPAGIGENTLSHLFSIHTNPGHCLWLHFYLN